MKCPACGHTNTDGAKFCNECAGPLPVRCLNCGTLNASGSKFCNECAVTLTAGAKRSISKTNTGTNSEIHIKPNQIDSSTAPDGERKTVTALFADIKGSMELMEDLDPEEARKIVDPALNLMIEAVRRYDGYIVQSTGDGIFALFGAPVAHEDHPQRALYSAFRMQDEMRRLAERLRAERGINLQVRIGANVGEVVVRSIQTGERQVEYTPIGHSTSLASRLQTLANPGSIAISDGLRKLVEGYFTLKALGPARIRGSSETVNVYEVTGLGPHRTRLQRAAGRGLTKFVGRQREIEALRDAAMLAREGRGQIVAAMADPGVGKSRLFYEFKATKASGWMLLEALSISHGKASAYLPVLDLLRNYFEIAVTDDERKRREKVAGKIAILDRSLEDTLPYLLSLLGIVEGDDPLAQIDAHVKKRRTLEAIKRILLRESLNQPLMVVFEDLHWMDSESEALLNLLADSIGTSRILLLVNYRPEYNHKWGSKTYYTQLRLDPLGKESAEEMLSTLLGNDATLVPLKRVIKEKTEGNPLFLEEICLSLFEDGTLARNGGVKLDKPLASLRIPPTVQGIIASRIDRLPADEKDLLQTVAVIGTEFNLGVARAVCGMSDDGLNRTLNDLQLAEFIYEQPAAGDVEYTFKHALTHEVAYNSLLTDRRKLLHERTAQAIEELYVERLDHHLTELAHHFAHSGNAPKAVEYLGRAGERAAEQGAHSEAAGYFTKALELLRRLPEGTSRDREELDLQFALSLSLIVAGRVRAPEREAALVRARELCEKLEDNAKLTEALLALAHVRIGWGDFEKARQLAEVVLTSNQPHEARAMLAGAHYIIGIVQCTAGQFSTAREHLEVCVSQFVANQSQNHFAFFARGAPNVLAGVLLSLGYSSTVRTRTDESLATARRSSDPHSIANALVIDLMNRLWLRDADLLEDRAAELLSIAAEHGAPFYFMVAATFARGYALAAAGKTDEGIAEMRQSISDPMIADALMTALLLTFLAEVCGKHRRPKEGLDLVTKGLATVERIGLRLAEAELHRLKGDLLLIKDPGNLAEPERCLRTAISVARHQSARFFELRATVSLARLLRKTNRRDEARTMLADIYNWFTEGFDTVDLKDAKALLDELSA